MRTIVGTMARLILLGFLLAFSSATLVAPSYAGEGYKDFWKKLEEKYGDCHHGYGWSIKCKKTTSIAPHAPSSTGLFVTKCNGEVGWWNAIPFQDGSVLCVAMSTADFYHNDGYLGATECTKTIITFWEGKHIYQKTKPGACPTHKSYEMPH